MTRRILTALFISALLITGVAAQPVDTARVADAEINGVSGNYLVDTGAQAIVLNRTRFASGDIETVTMNHVTRRR